MYSLANKGYVRKRVFFNLLECMDFKLTQDNIDKIESLFCQNSNNNSNNRI